MESTTLPRDFRLNYRNGDHPRTPEAPAQDDLQPPSLPKARLRVRRRNVSNVSGPTEHFLASVAAADFPLPSIEVPQTGEDVQMLDRSTTPVPDLERLDPRQRYGGSEPRTPVPQLLSLLDENTIGRRDWYMDPRYPFNEAPDRPSSALSNPSDFSDFSDETVFSIRPVSRPSEDSSCTSPDTDLLDPFSYPASTKDKGLNIVTEVTFSYGKETVLNHHIRRKTRNDAPWSKDMSDHLWQTLQVYLQDPTVTPFHMGLSRVPPEGVVHRVAREAKRSWKGPKSTAAQLANQRLTGRTADNNTGSPDNATSKSGSITPTANTAITKVYLPWYHSSSATRSHLRDLCKRKKRASVHRYRHGESRSPTPFTESRMRTTDNGKSRNTFTTEEVVLSLVTSSSQSMQPDGPLSELTKSVPSRLEGIHMVSQSEFDRAYLTEKQTRRLGSPFGARTYGPSSSNAFSSLSKPSPPRPKSGTVATSGPLLRSPLRFDQPRSLNGTQKRRAQHPLEDELSPRGGVIRPSILDEQLFGRPLESQQRRVRSRGFSLGDETLVDRVPRLFEDIRSVNNATSNSASRPVTPLLPSIDFGTPGCHQWRPLAEIVSSNTFPARLPLPMDGTTGTVKKHPFTVHHSRHSIESFDFGDGPSLQSRLTHLDDKISEIRTREPDSPS